MTTQYTSILKLALPVQGELSGTWGDVVNDNITSMVEEAVAGRAVINTWTTNSHTLTTADGTTSESRCAMLEFTDTGAALTGAATVVCPSASKLYVCKNGSGQQVTIQTAAGTGVAIPDGQTMFVFCDGTNVEQCETNFNSLSFNGYTLNFGGAVTTAGAFTTSGAYALTLTTTGATNVTLPTTGTLATLDGTETLTNKTLTAPTISSPSLTGSISATDLTISGNTTIGDAAADTLTVNGTITSNLIFTDDTYDIGAVGATRPRNLYLSGNATIGGTVTLSGGIDVTGGLGVDGDFDVNTDKFTVASATGNTLVAGTLGVTGITTATGGLNVDTISEITASGGVTVDSVLLKDGGATFSSTVTLSGTDPNIVLTDTDTNFDNRISANSGAGFVYLDLDLNNETATSGFAIRNHASTELFSVNDEGIAALGVTPEAWYTGSTPDFSALQLGTAAAISGTDSTAFMALSTNAYRDSAGWKYINADYAARYDQDDAAHTWYYAASGTADAPITWTTGMNLSNSGTLTVDADTLYVDATNDRVGINTTPSYALDVISGAAIIAEFEGTNADSGILSVKNTQANPKFAYYQAVSNNGTAYFIRNGSGDGNNMGTTNAYLWNSNGPISLVANQSIARRFQFNTDYRAVIGTQSTTGIRLGTRLLLNDAGGSSSNQTGLVLASYNSGTANGPFIDLLFSKTATDGAYTSPSTNEQTGYLVFRAADGTANTWRSVAQIETLTNGSVGTGAWPGKFIFYTGNTTGSTITAKLQIAASNVTVNDGQANHDFYIKTTGSAYGIFVDADAATGSNLGAVGIFNSAPLAPLDIRWFGTVNGMGETTLALGGSSGSHASGLTFYSHNTNYAQNFYFNPATGDLSLRATSDASTITTHHAFNNSGAVTFNESGAGVDFRVESVSSQYMFVVDGSDNVVRISDNNTFPTSTEAQLYANTSRQINAIFKGVHGTAMYNRYENNTSGVQYVYHNFRTDSGNGYIIKNGTGGGNSLPGTHLYLWNEAGGSGIGFVPGADIANEVRINTSGNVVMKNGRGIDFSATGNGSGTMTSELLDDYEEGTWTPTIVAKSTNFTSVTYGTQNGTYTKVGNLVTLTGRLDVDATSGGSGALCIGGLPYSSSTAMGGTLGYISGVNYDSATYNQLGLYLPVGGGDKIIFTLSGDNTGAIETPSSNITGTFDCSFTITYIT